MVEWLCSLDNIDVTVCGGEALSWARENYHLSVEEILESKVNKYEAEKGLTPGATLKQTHQRHYHREISKPLVPSNKSLITTEFELARLQASAYRKQRISPSSRDPSFRVPNTTPNESFDMSYIGENSFLMTPEVSKVGKRYHSSTSTSNVSFRKLGVSSSTRSLITSDGSENTTEERKSTKKDVFAKPVGLGSRSRSRPPSARRMKSKSTQVDNKTAPDSFSRGLPMTTPRTKLKNHCLDAANKLGTLPAAPHTEHRKKIARMREKQDSVIVNSHSIINDHKGKSSPESKSSQLENAYGKRKAVADKFDSPPRVKRQKIRPRTDGPITRTQQRGFMKMRDRLLKQGVITKEIRRSLNKEETEQIMRRGGSS